jgi:hypothetical protein
MTRSLSELSIPFSLGRLAFGVPTILSELCSALKDVLVVYLIDEAENFTPWQQRFVNTLIRYRKGNTTLKVGARLYGIRTYDTLGSGEPIKRDAEYERSELDSFLREHESQYKVFCHDLIAKRLQLNNLQITRSGKIELSGFFEELDSNAYYQKPTLEILKTWDRDSRERPHLAKFRKALRECFELTDRQIDDTVNAIKLKDFPLVEKASLLHFYRRWPDSPDGVVKLAREISGESRLLVSEGRAAAPNFWQVLDHFSSDLLSQLFRDCQRRSPYAGLETLIHLSQGAPRNLLAILKHIYRRSYFAGEKPFAGGTISIESQSEGVMDSAAWFWEDAQPESYGSEVRDSIEALAVLFRTIRYSETPSECDLCTFSVALGKLTKHSKLIIDTAENWSYLIRIRVDAKNRNNQQIHPKYQLAPMLAPKWALSPNRRGAIEIQYQLANALFDPEHRDQLTKLFKRRVQNMLVANFGRRKTDGNSSLFS